MKADAFKAWLKQEYALGGARSRYSEACRVERFHGDLDRQFDRDQLTTLIAEFAYSTRDARSGRPNPTCVAIDGDVRNGLASLKSALQRYSRFRQDVGRRRMDAAGFPSIDAIQRNGSGTRPDQHVMDQRGI